MFKFKFKKRMEPVITFTDSHFCVCDDSGEIVMQREDIIQIAVFKEDSLILDDIIMQISNADKLMKLREDWQGWNEFQDKIKAKFPEIPENWEGMIMQPPFAENFTTVYKKPLF